MIVGCLVFVRRFAALRQWGWAGACVATVVAVGVLAAWPDLDGVSVRLVIASAILFGFVAALAAHLMRGLPHADELMVEVDAIGTGAPARSAPTANRPPVREP
jgi:hypothetical protein